MPSGGKLPRTAGERRHHRRRRRGLRLPTRAPLPHRRARRPRLLAHGRGRDRSPTHFNNKVKSNNECKNTGKYEASITLNYSLLYILFKNNDSHYYVARITNLYSISIINLLDDSYFFRIQLMSYISRY